MNFIVKKLEEKTGETSDLSTRSWSTQGHEGGTDFLGFHPPSPHVCVDDSQARKEGKKLRFPYQSC